jgi:hypothetical protein
LNVPLKPLLFVTTRRYEPGGRPDGSDPTALWFVNDVSGNRVVSTYMVGARPVGLKLWRAIMIVLLLITVL